MCFSMFLLGFILPGTLHFLDLVDSFLSHVRDIFSYYLSEYFLGSVLSPFSFWEPYNANVGVFNIVPSVSWAVFIFFFILFSIFCFTTVIYTILSSKSLICFSASVILLLVPSSVLFISCLFVFSSFRSLVNI